MFKYKVVTDFKGSINGVEIQNRSEYNFLTSILEQIEQNISNKNLSDQKIKELVIAISKNYKDLSSVMGELELAEDIVHFFKLYKDEVNGFLDKEDVLYNAIFNFIMNKIESLNHV